MILIQTKKNIIICLQILFFQIVFLKDIISNIYIIDFELIVVIVKF